MLGWSELSLCSRCELYGQIVHFTNQNACGERKKKKKSTSSQCIFIFFWEFLDFGACSKTYIKCRVPQGHKVFISCINNHLKESFQSLSCSHQPSTCVSCRNCVAWTSWGADPAAPQLWLIHVRACILLPQEVHLHWRSCLKIGKDNLGIFRGFRKQTGRWKHAPAGKLGSPKHLVSINEGCCVLPTLHCCSLGNSPQGDQKCFNNI